MTLYIFLIAVLFVLLFSIFTLFGKAEPFSRNVVEFGFCKYWMVRDNFSLKEK